MEQVAPLTRHVLLDGVEFVLIWIHVLVLPFLLLVLPVQWMSRKGTRQHLTRGRWIGFLLVPVAVSSGILLLLHNLLRPEQFGRPPAGPVIPNFIGATFLPGFALGLIGCVANGVLPVRHLRRLWPLHLLNVVIVVVSVMFFHTLLTELFTGNPDTYHWQLSLELAVLGTVIPAVGGLNLLVLVRVERGGMFDWESHHKMNMIILTAAILATLMLFFAHDRYWVLEGGVGMWTRLLIQIGPVALFLGPFSGFFFDYLSGGKAARRRPVPTR
jgi:hypothetical protein